MEYEIIKEEIENNLKKVMKDIEKFNTMDNTDYLLTYKRKLQNLHNHILDNNIL